MKKERYISYLLFILIILVSIVNNRCYYDSKEYLFPESTNLCDTTNISFTATVQPVLSQYCLACHSNANAAGLGSNIKLEDYADVAKKAKDGSLVGSISRTGSYSPMPKNASKLSDCVIQGITKWVEEGSQNN